MITPSIKKIAEDLFEVEIKFTDIPISKEEIEGTIGYAKGKIPEHFSEMIDDIVLQIESHCNIKAGFRILDVKNSENEKDGLYIGDTFFNLDKIVTGQLKKSVHAAVFVCTIGPMIESLAKEAMANGDPALGFMIDTAASVTVESATDLLHDLIENEMLKQGLRITNRYSPGYCNWHVSEQQKIFSLLPKHFCDITLTDSSLMIPIKSVSGIIGIGTDVRRIDYICNACGVKDCTYRSNRSIKS